MSLESADPHDSDLWEMMILTGPSSAQRKQPTFLHIKHGDDNLNKISLQPSSKPVVEGRASQPGPVYTGLVT